MNNTDVKKTLQEKYEAMSKAELRDHLVSKDMMKLPVCGLCNRRTVYTHSCMTTSLLKSFSGLFDRNVNVKIDHLNGLCRECTIVVFKDLLNQLETVA